MKGPQQALDCQDSLLKPTFDGCAVPRLERARVGERRLMRSLL